LTQVNAFSGDLWNVRGMGLTLARLIKHLENEEVS